MSFLTCALCQLYVCVCGEGGGPLIHIQHEAGCGPKRFDVK